jgi:acyl-CoA thioester hydrolase
MSRAFSVAPDSTPVWFEYPVRVQPHHTDYGGVVWHGAYIAWLESARIECLRAAGVSFEQLVELGYDLPVIDLSLRYRQPLRLGDRAVVKTRLAPVTGVRLNWLYEIEAIGAGGRSPCVTAQISLVTVDTAQRKILRRLPTEIKTAVKCVSTYLEQPL